jgi:hypothetical protein
LARVDLDVLTVGSFLGMGAFVGGLIAAGVGVLVAHAEGGNSVQSHQYTSNVQQSSIVICRIN